jgi:hypothetical protein
MKYLETWWSPVAQAYRVEDGEMFTYYSVAEVVGHFVHRQLLAGALIVPPPHDRHTAELVRALEAAGFTVAYTTP